MPVHQRGALTLILKDEPGNERVFETTAGASDFPDTRKKWLAADKPRGDDLEWEPRMPTSTHDWLLIRSGCFHRVIECKAPRTVVTAAVLVVNSEDLRRQAMERQFQWRSKEKSDEFF